MPKLECIIAETKKQVDDALRVRWKVFVDECQYLQRAPYVTRREFDAFDSLETTIHFVGYVDGEAAATVRLLLPNEEVAAESNTDFGIDLEGKYDLAQFREAGIRLAECPRSSVVRKFQRTGILMHLYAEMYRTSRRTGVTHWVASANTETDHPGDADHVYRLAEESGFVSGRWHVHARHESPAPPQSRHRLFEDVTKPAVFPRTLGIFAQTMGARYIGKPVYDAGFHMYAIPLALNLDEVPYELRCSFEGRPIEQRKAG